MAYFIQGDIEDEWVRSPAFFIDLYDESILLMNYNKHLLYVATNYKKDPFHGKKYCCICTANYQVYIFNDTLTEFRQMICLRRHFGAFSEENNRIKKHILCNIKKGYVMNNITIESHQLKNMTNETKINETNINNIKTSDSYTEYGKIIEDRHKHLLNNSDVEYDI